MAGRLTLDLSLLATAATAQHDATETLAGGGPAMVLHDQSIFNGETRLVGELGVTDWLAAGVLLPVRVYNTSIDYLASDGRPVAIENPDVHHRNETLTGIGDPWLVGRMTRRVGAFSVGARLGVTIPLGRTEPDPFELGDSGLRHEHSQFGTGTFVPIVGIDAARAFGSFSLDASAISLQSLYANEHRYQAGDRYAIAAGAASAFGTKQWRFRGTLESQAETAERWDGMIRTEEGNTGRIDFLVGAEATWMVLDDWRVTASLRLPVYSRVEGGQLDVAGFFGLSIGTHMGLFEGRAPAHAHEDEHEHEHGDKDNHEAADWSGLDKLDLTDDGSAVSLVPVPGKITVFDFWATWCKPCGELEHELHEIARRHPEQVAIRKINTVDADSPASQKYLVGFTLPHIKVFGRDGKLLFERSAPPRELAGELEKAIAASARR